MRLLANIYTAGKTIDEARPKIMALLDQGFSITSDILGEFVCDPRKMTTIVNTYLYEHIPTLGNWNNLLKMSKISLAIKPSLIGSEIDEKIFRSNLENIVSMGYKLGVFIWVDAEKRKGRDAILDTITKIRKAGYNNIGFAVQCIHSDAKNVLLKLLEQNVAVRLVKGAYTDGDLKSREEINKNFKDCFRTALCYYKNVPLEKRAVVAVGTHDGELINYALAFDKDPDIRSLIQIQMLYGVRVKLQQELASVDKNVLIYVPWGSDASEFLKRRLKEGIRPSTIWIFLRNIVEAIRFG